METKHVWIDTDPGIDDAFAIVAALTLPDVLVHGISATFGNSSTEQCSYNLRRLMRAFKTSPHCRYIPKLYKGPVRALDAFWQGAAPTADEVPVHGRDGLGDITDEELRAQFPEFADEPLPALEQRSFICGVEEALQECKKAGAPLYFVSLGAMTSLSIIANVLSEDYVRWVRPIIMGGAFPENIRAATAGVRGRAYQIMLSFSPTFAIGNMVGAGVPCSENNVYRDITAASDVLCTRGPPIFVLDWCLSISAAVGGEKLRQRFLHPASPFARFLARISSSYADFSFEPEAFHLIICDLVAMWAGLYQKGLKETVTGTVRQLVTTGPERGRTVLEPAQNGNVTVAVDVPDEMLDAMAEHVVKLMDYLHIAL